MSKANYVEVFIPKGAPGDEPNLLVGVNGVMYNLPKGKKSKVPPEVKAEIDRSIQAQEKLDETIDRLLEESK